MKIHIRTIDHKDQRYPTCGDWWKDKDTSVNEIRVSKLSDKRYEFLIALHEMIEQELCQTRGVDEQDITDFDTEFEVARQAGNNSEPGDSPLAPYNREHFFATTIERLMATELDVDWETYEKEVNSL